MPFKTVRLLLVQPVLDLFAIFLFAIIVIFSGKHQNTHPSWTVGLISDKDQNKFFKKKTEQPSQVNHKST